jgi:hypothetical protein
LQPWRFGALSWLDEIGFHLFTGRHGIYLLHWWLPVNDTLKTFLKFGERANLGVTVLLAIRRQYQFIIIVIQPLNQSNAATRKNDQRFKHTNDIGIKLLAIGRQSVGHISIVKRIDKAALNILARGLASISADDSDEVVEAPQLMEVK